MLRHNEKQQNFQELRRKGSGDGGEQEEWEEEKGKKGGEGGEGAHTEHRLDFCQRVNGKVEGKRLSGKPCFLSRRIYELRMKTFSASWHILQLRKPFVSLPAI